MRKTLRCLGVLVLGVFLALPLGAQEEMPPTNIVNQSIDVRPLPGHGAAFEQGVRDYMAWAVEAGNDWVWLAWEVIAGENTGEFRFGTYGHEWAGFDSPPVDPARTSAAIDQHISGHVESVRTAFTVTRQDLSNITTPGPAPLYMVFTYQVKPGMAEQFESAMRRYRDLIVHHAPEAQYLVHQTVVGGEAGSYLLAVPMQGMGAMATMPNIDGAMREALGDFAWRRLGEEFYDTIASEQTGLVALRADLSLNYSPPE